MELQYIKKHIYIPQSLWITYCYYLLLNLLYNQEIEVKITL